MAGAIPTLGLSLFWRKQQRLLLVRATDAFRLCREDGYRQIPPRTSMPHLLQGVRKCPGDVRRFLARANLATLALVNCDDDLLLDRLLRLCEQGTLVVVEEGKQGAASETSSLVKQRRVLRAFDQGKRASLKFEGRSYRLVADADVGKLPDRDSYAVVLRDEAVRALDGMGKLATPAEAAQLLEVRKQLSRDWRPPMSPDGLVLLRKLVVAQSVPRSEAPLGKLQRSSGGKTTEAPAEEEEACRPCAALAQANQAAALTEASEEGIPFCEECDRPSAAAP